MEIIILLAIIMMLFVGLIFSPLGLGGGVLFVPIFLYLLQWQIHVTLLASLILVWMVSLGSRVAHNNEGYADRECAEKGIITALPGAVIGTIIAALLISRFSDLSIKAAAAVILGWVIYKSVLKLIGEMNDNGSKGEAVVLEGELLKKYRLACLGAGVSSGMLGIGGGTLFMTAHRSLLNFNAHKSAGTSYILESWMIPLAIAAHLLIDGSGSALVDAVGLPILLLVPAAVAGMAFVGAKFAMVKLPQRALTIIFIVAVSASLSRYLWDIAGQML